MATRDLLPVNVKPIHYGISIYDIELGGEFSYKGRVQIEFKLVEPTNILVVNTSHLNVLSAKVTDSNGSVRETRHVQHDDSLDRTTLEFGDSPIQHDGTLEISFTGTINNEMAGFYRSRYKPTVKPVPSVPQVGDYHFMFSTQFEACDARRAFPCFDEPNLKASFDFEIEIPEDQTALSNMPVKETKKSTKDGLKIVSFERTPVMSTYLLAWAFGDFSYVESETKRTYSHGKPLPVRVYTTRGLEEQGRFALENAAKILDYFSEIFDVEYPLPKSDLLAVHEFSHGAMENWGLVTYRTAMVLFDEKTTGAKAKKVIAYVVAHELAHQWFGDLVTMDWWSELWLNEGFATWVGWFAVDHFYPEWNVWAQLLTEGGQVSLDLDALRSSHPIEVPVRNAPEIDQVFDAISYLKGSAVIRMLSAHLGVRTFLKGVSDYLKKHAYGNATTSALWAALSSASGKDVDSFMDTWIRRIGYPVLTIAEEPGQITIRQSRFLSTGDVKPEEDETLWWLPLALRTGPDISKVSTVALYAKEDTIRDIDDDFYKLNSDAIGFYRTNYPPERLARLGAARAKLSVSDRIALVADADALAVAGAGTAAGLLNLCAEFQGETEFLVWEQVAASLNKLRSVFGKNEAIQNGLNKFTLHLISPMLETVGWIPKPNESLLELQLRGLVISMAAIAGHQKTIDESLRLVQQSQNGDESTMLPDLRPVIYATAIRSGGPAQFEHVKALAAAEGAPDKRDAALKALGVAPTDGQVHDLLEFIVSDAVSTQDKHSPLPRLASNPHGRDAMWEWFKAHWDRVTARMGSNPAVISRFIRLSLNDFSDHATQQDIASFFAKQDTTAFDKILAQVLDAIKRNANYRERDEKLILEWLQAKGFA